FSAKDFKTIETLVDLIIPRTDTPGALDAGVPIRIDQQVFSKPDLQEVFSRGLASLAPDFTALPQSEQVAALQLMNENPDTPGGKFFRTVKNLTIEWYYRSEQGMVEELGFKGNTFRASFPGCTHPEHWPSEEKI